MGPEAVHLTVVEKRNGMQGGVRNPAGMVQRALGVLGKRWRGLEGRWAGAGGADGGGGLTAWRRRRCSRGFTFDERRRSTAKGD